ncbi:MAG TPA: hypothetical protein VGP72_31500 [Planctomycetota bacterium]|jgi:hypothetical protein
MRNFLCIALLAALATSCFSGTLPADKLGRFVVPRMSKPPVLDGRIDPEEWNESVAIGGLAQQNPGGNLLVMRPTTYFVAWDADHIYIACRTWIMPGYKPHVGGRGPGAVTAFDDGMEFSLKPMGKNVPPGRADSSYKFFVTCLGNDGDLARVSVGQLFRNWQPHIKAATRLTEPNSAPLGGRWWEAEISLSTQDVELAGPNQSGDAWRMLLAFNHIPGWMQAAIPITSGYFDASGFPEFILGENVPSVHVTMDELPGPMDGTASAQFSIFNPTPQATQVSVLAQYSEAREKAGAKDAELDELLKKEQTLSIEPGKSAVFKVSEKLPRDLGQGTGGIYYRVTQAIRKSSDTSCGSNSATKSAGPSTRRRRKRFHSRARSTRRATTSCCRRTHTTLTAQPPRNNCASASRAKVTRRPLRRGRLAARNTSTSRSCYSSLN